jgi:hypothetical protein
MNTEQHINRFDELIRQKLDSYEAEPDMDLLVNIHARKNRFLNSRNLLTLMILLVILTAGIIGGYFYSGARLKQGNQPGDSVTSYYKNSGEGLLQGFGNNRQSEAATSQNNRHNYNAFFNNNTLVSAVQHTAAGAQNTHSVSHNTQNNLNISGTNFTFTTSTVNNQAAPGNQQSVDVKNTQIANNKDAKGDHTPEDGKTPDETTCTVNFDYYTSYDDAFHFISNTSVPSQNVVLKWTFGDGESSTEANPKHLYAKPGQYAATLTALNTVTNCKAEVYKLIRVSKGIDLTSSTIKGTVFADAEYAGKTIVQLIEYNSKLNTFEVVQTTLTSNKGVYEFSDVLAGNYLVKSAAYKNYSSTFYGNNTDREYATNITVFANDYKLLSGYDIQLVNNRPLPGSPLVKSDEPGSRIMIIVDENNQPLVTVVVGKDGVINTPVNLPNGDYKLLDPETGKVAGDVTVDKGGAASKLGSSSGEITGPGQEKNLSLAPNPANEYVKVSLSNASSSNVEITIINGIGSVVQQYTLPGGSGINSLDINHLPGGTYYIIARQDGVVTSSTLVKAVDNSK